MNIYIFKRTQYKRKYISLISENNIINRLHGKQSDGDQIAP